MNKHPCEYSRQCSAPVHISNPLYIARTHRDPLPDRHVCHLRYDRRQPVHTERVRIVVHHATIVIPDTVIDNAIRTVRLEVTLAARYNVLPEDVHVQVAFGRALHVVEAECVN